MNLFLQDKEKKNGHSIAAYNIFCQGTGLLCETFPVRDATQAFPLFKF
jgi:hypothetical protein